MDYLEKYIEIVSADYSAFNGYTESHHIIPKSWMNNIFDHYRVDLPAEKHFEAHWNLHKAFPEDVAMSRALWLMCNFTNEIWVTAEMYKEAREAAAKAASKAMAGAGNSMYGVSISRPCKEETKAKLRKINLGKKHSERTKTKISEKTKGMNNPRADETIRTFKHKDGLSFKGTRVDFTTKFALCNSHVGKLIHGTSLSCKGWELF